MKPKIEMIEIIYRWPDGRDEVRYRRSVDSRSAKAMILEVERLKERFGSECPYRIEVSK